MPGTATLQPEFAEMLTRYLAQRFDAPSATLTLTRLSQGWESDILRVDSSLWPTPRVLRLYFGAHAGPTAQQEGRAMELLAQAGYPAPRVELVEAATDTLGRPFLMMDYIGGVSLGRRIHEPATRDAGYVEFCELLAQLHTLRWKHLPAAQQIPAITVEQQVGHWADFGRRYPLEAFDALFGWLTAHAAEIKPQPLGMVHWDFHWENILVDERGKSWVIDWTQCQATDVRFDLAWTLVLVGSMLGWDAAARVRSGYAEARGISPDELAHDMDFFEAAAGAKRVLSVLISLQYGADSLGMRPGAEETMRGALPSIAQVYQRWLDLTSVPLAEAETLLAAYL